MILIGGLSTPLFFLTSTFGMLTLIVCCTIYLWIATKAKWKSLFWVFGSIIAGVMANLLTYTSLLGLYNFGIIPIRNGTFYGILKILGITIFTLLICLGVRKLLTKFKVKELIRPQYTKYIVFTLVTVVSAFLSNVVVLRGVDLEISSLITLLFTFLAFIGVIVIIMVGAVETTKERLQAENQQALLEQLSEYTEQVEKESEIIRKSRHDYINILTSMTGFLDNKDYNGLEKYIYDVVLSNEQRLHYDTEQIAKLRNIKIPPVKGLLANKLSFAQLSEINVSIEILKEINEWSIKDYDIVRMLGIILDNAIEESSHCEEAEINIAIFPANKNYKIIVSNKCRSNTEHPEKLKELGYSTKGEGRGLGLSNLFEIISTYDEVVLTTTVNEGVFTQELTI